jgi:FkbM family methyltransferase
MEKTIAIDNKDYFLTSDDIYLEAMGDNFEPHMVALFKALVGPDDVVADIGANIGLTSILFSSLAKKVISFEPTPSTYKILVENLSRAGADNVEPVNFGLGKQVESQTITFAKNNRSGGYVSDKIRLEIGHQTEQINIETLDHFFNGRSTQPSFLKIDVEGFEQNVIRGGEIY